MNPLLSLSRNTHGWLFLRGLLFPLTTLFLFSSCRHGGASETASDPTPRFDSDWVFFAPVEASALRPEDLTRIPGSLTGSDDSSSEARPAEFRDRKTDLVARLNDGVFVPEKTLAVFYNTVTCASPQPMQIGAGADWWMTWYVNGKEVYSTQPGGNGRLDFNVFDHQFTLPLQAGRNVIAVKVWSGSAGWSFAAADGPALQHLEKELVTRPLDAVITSPLSPPEDLPDPLLADGEPPITSAEDWMTRGRPKLIEYYVREQYGRLPEDWDRLEFKWIEEPATVPGTEILRSVLEIRIERNGKSLQYPVTFFTPPADRAIRGTWIKINHRNRDFSLAPDDGFCPITTIIDQGYALISYPPGIVAPDHVELFKEGILHLYPEELEKPDGCRTIGAWAWGVSRIIDYLHQDSRFPNERIAVIGHSRSANTAQWSAVVDTRIGLVCSNNGDSLKRRPYGQPLSKTNLIFPHWYNENYKKYSGNPSALPFDAHWLVAGVAPRDFHLGSGALDLNADPRGQYLAVRGANKVYSLFGKAGLPEKEAPVLNQCIFGEGLAFHVRMGGHDLTALDWSYYLDHADRIWPAPPSSSP